MNVMCFKKCLIDTPFDIGWLRNIIKKSKENFEGLLTVLGPYCWLANQTVGSQEI